MAEETIPVITQLKDKLGIGLNDPQHPLHVSGTIRIDAAVNDDLLSWHGGGLRRESEQGGFVIGSDSSVMVHAGDNRGSIWSWNSFNDTTTTERLYLTSDFDVEIHTGLQQNSGVWDTHRWRFLDSGSTEFPTSASVYNKGFVSGFVGGTGWQIRKTGDMTFAEFDNVLVRNTLQTHIFQKDVVKATNGQLYVSDSGVIAATNGSSTVTFNSQSATFSNNDLLQFKDVNPDSGAIVSVKFRINDSSPSYDSDDNATYDVDDITGNLSDLVIGGTAVRISGGTLLLDASSPNSPFMDVLSGSSMVVRTGNLAGITSDKFGSLSNSGFGFYASGSAFLEGSINADGGEIGGWTIDSTTISSANIKLDTVSDGGRIVVGTLTGDSTSTSNYGFLAKNDGTVLIKGNESNTNYIKFTTTALDINADTFKLDTPNLDIDSAAKTITVGSSVIISGSANSNQGQIKVGSHIELNGDDTSTISGWTIGNGEISGTNAKLKSSGVLSLGSGTDNYNQANRIYIDGANTRVSIGTGFKYTSDVLTIADWDVGSSVISSSGTIGSVILQSGDSPRISFKSGSTSLVTVGEITSGTGLAGSQKYGMAINDTDGSLIAKFGMLGNQIAGWDVTSTQLANSNVTMSNADGGKISLNNGTTFLSGSGEGQFANGGIQFDKSGNVIITGSVTIGSDVTVNADVAIGSLPNFPTTDLLAHYDFAAGTGSTIIDNSGNGQDMTIVQYDTARSVWTLDSPAGGAFTGSGTGGGGSSTGDYAVTGNTFNCGASITVTSWLNWSGLNASMAWAIDTDAYAGLNLYWVNDFINLNTGDGANNSYAMGGTKVHSPAYQNKYHHYAVTIDASLNKSLLYIDGTLVGSASYKDPTTTNDQFYISKYGSNNGYHWNGKIAQVRVYDKALTEGEIQSLFLYPDGPGGTRISGDTISTGVIKSNNLTSTAGSQIDLTNGTIKLGGTTSPDFAVDAAGNLTGSSALFDGTINVTGTGTIAGWTIGDYFIGKVNNPTNFYSMFASNAQQAISNTHHAAKPVLSFYNSDSDSRFMVNVGNIYKNTSNMGLAVFSNYADNTKIFEASEHETDGTLTAQIAGWEFDNEKLIKNIGSSGFIEMRSQATSPRFMISPDGDISGGSGNFVQMFSSSASWGINMRDGGVMKFQLGSINQIAGWTFSESELSAGSGDSKISIASSVPKIVIGKKTTLDANFDGVYISSDGISLGQGTPFKVTSGGSLTAKDGTIGGWAITATSLSSSNNTMEITPSKGIIARNETSHSLESFSGYFSFATAHHSIGPGSGGQTVDSQGEILSQGNNNQYDSDPGQGN